MRRDDRVADKVGFAIDAKIAYIDVNPRKMHQIRGEREPEFSYLGDAATALDDLTDYAQRNGMETTAIDDWIQYAADLKRSWPLDYRRDADRIQQAEVLDLMNRRITDGMIFTTGVGNHQLLAAQYLRMKRPRTYGCLVRPA